MVAETVATPLTGAATVSATAGEREMWGWGNHHNSGNLPHATNNTRPSKLTWSAPGLARSACLISGAGGGVTEFVLDGREHADR